MNLLDKPLKNVLELFDSNSKRDILLSMIKVYTENKELEKDKINLNNKNKINIIKILKEFCINDNSMIKSYFSMNILSNLILKEFIFKSNSNNLDDGEELLKLITDMTNIIKINKKLKYSLNENYIEEIDRFLIIDKKCENDVLSKTLKLLISALLEKN